MSFTPADLPDLTGRTVVVTGANSGIGFHAAREFARHGAGVVLAVRDVEAGERAASLMPGAPRVEHLDLAALASVHAFAERWSGPLHVLVNNAGVMTPPRYRETVDGFELQFGTNHLGPFALTGLLWPALTEAAGRVVAVSSIVHHHGDASVVEGNPRAGYVAQRAYGNSKLADLLFTRELQRRADLSGSPVSATAAHPGVSATNLVGSRDGLGSIAILRAFAPLFTTAFFQSAEHGAWPVEYAATLAEPGSYSGPQYLFESRGPVGVARRSPYATDDRLARELWKRSEELTGVRFPI